MDEEKNKKQGSVELNDHWYAVQSVNNSLV